MSLLRARYGITEMQEEGGAREVAGADASDCGCEAYADQRADCLGEGDPTADATTLEPRDSVGDCGGDCC